MKTSGALLCTLGMTILGSSVALSRLLLDYPTLTGQALRYAVATAVLALIAARLPRPPAAPDRLTRRDVAVLAALAATGLAGFNVCVLTALRHADAAVVGTVVGASPLGLALLAPVLAGRRPAARLVLAAGVVTGGTALVEGTGHAAPIGLLAAFGALLGEVSFSLLAAMVLPRLGALRVSAYSCGIAVPLLALTAVAAGEPARWRPPTAAEALVLGYLALVLTVGAFLAWFAGLRRLGVARAGMFVGVLPVATLLTAAVQDARLPAAGPAAGVAVVAVGLAIGLTGRPRSSPARSAADDQGPAPAGRRRVATATS